MSKMLQARLGAGIKYLSDDHIIIKMIRVVLPGVGGGEAVLAEYIDKSVSPWVKKFKYTGDPNTAWGEWANLDITLTHYTYPCSYLTFGNKLWITNGADKVYLWDGMAIHTLSDDIFMRGKFITSFQNRVILLNTPEASYNWVYNRFHDPDHPGKEIFADTENAWSAENIHSNEEIGEIVGATPLTDNLLAILGTNGIFAVLWAGIYPTRFEKISDIECVLGDYLIPKRPIVFDNKRKAYEYMGDRFQELLPIRETIKNDDNKRIRTEEIHYNTKREWDRGTYTDATSSWIEDVLTLAPELGTTFPDHYMEGENQKEYYSDSKEGWVGSEVKVAQSFICEAWPRGGNIPKCPKAVQLRIRNGAPAGDPVVFTIRAEIVKYDNLPFKVGLTNMGREVIATFKGDSSALSCDAEEWVTLKLETTELTDKLTIGNLYFIEPTCEQNWCQWVKRSSAHPDYPYGYVWEPEPSPGEDFTFQVYYFPTETPPTAGALTSPSFYKPAQIQGQALSMSVSYPKYIEPTFEIKCAFKTADSEAGLTAVGVDWVDRIIVNSTNKYPEPFNLDALPLKNWFVFKVSMAGSWAAEDKFFTPLVYAVRIQCKTSEGRIVVQQVEHKTYVNLLTTSLVHTPMGWFKNEEATQVKDEEASVTGDGTVGPYKWTLAQKPVIPIVLSVKDEVPQEQFVDKLGLGILVGSKGGSGTIDYRTGVVNITFGNNLTSGKKIYVTYYYGLDLRYIVPWGFTGSGEWAQVGNARWCYFASYALQDTGDGTKDINLLIKTGLIDAGKPEEDKIWRMLRIAHETSYSKAIPFKLSFYTDRGSHIYTPDVTFDPGVSGGKHIRIWEFPFPNVNGKYIVFDEISQKKLWTQGIKEIELFYTVERKSEIPIKEKL